MDSSPNIFDLGIDQWSVDARLRLIDQIWESLPPGTVDDIPEEHRAIIDERLAAAEANPEAARPWREVMAELMARR